MDQKIGKEERKQRRKAWKAEARQKAAAYLKEKKSRKGPEKAALKAELKAAGKQWKAELKTLDKAQRKDQKAARKAFRRRKNALRRGITWGAVLALVLCIVMAVSPIVSMLMGVMSSQNYTDTGAAADEARAAGYALSREICDEGFVLMKNDGDVLPLAAGAKVSIFGDDAYNFVYGGSGSAGADQSGATSIFDAFRDAGIVVNEELDSVYRDQLGLTGEGADGGIGAMLVAYFTGQTNDGSGDWHALDDPIIQAAREYSDTAIIVLSAQETEGTELALSLVQPDKAGTNKAAVIDAVCGAFDHVIFIINSGNVMELGFMEQYDSADAALWVGSPGSLGCEELARVLLGEVNPSGRTVDTWPVSIEAEPGYITYGDYQYTNLDTHVFSYNEGIYVGYRYYETWYGADPAAYAGQVVFPFGHGLSYTQFTQELTAFAADDETVTAEVTVTNTGDRAGKDVVELYFLPPWTEGGIEKSAIELAAFGKTAELAPGDSETVTLTFPTRDMSSWSKAEGCYVLEAGEYKIALGADVHQALLSRDYETYEVDAAVKYTADDATGAALKNLFAFAEGDETYMSRSDMAGTFPVHRDAYTASEETLAAKAAYEQYAAPGTAQIPAADNGIKLSELKGLDYDDPKWDAFLDQFTAEEMIAMTANGGWHTEAVERLGVPATRLLDGPSGINSMLSPVDAVAYPMETVISSSWNTDMAARLGEVIGDEANVYGVNGWYAPAMNIHRTSIGGRNSEYYSEDPLLAGKMAAASIRAVQDKGVIAFMKHFVCNDVELNARGDVSIWVDEQALREIYLRPFELAVKEGGAAGAMSSFSRLGMEWCGGSHALLYDLLRTEWGFRGVVTTDACLGGWMNAEAATKNGNDLMLEMGLQQSVSKLEKAYKADPDGVAYGLRNSVHNICYAIVNGTDLA